MQNKPWLILISGPNGAGKTTFHDRILAQNPFLHDAIFANWDNERKKLSETPENKSKMDQLKNELQTAIEQKPEEIKAKLLSRFKKLMEQVGGDIHERIDRKNDTTKDYWTEQFSMSIHVQPEYEYVLENLNTYTDLMRAVGGGNIHERINAKSSKNNWYKLYKKLVYTLEVQKAIQLYPYKQKIAAMDYELDIDSGKICSKKIDKILQSGKNLIYETTGTGNKAKRVIKAAKNLGYSVYSFHPYLLRPELSIARVQHRVETGGHDVPKDLILSRYDGSLRNLATLLSMVDIGIVMDNSGRKPYTPIFAQCNGYFTDFSQCPEYLQKSRDELLNMKDWPQKSVAELLHLPQNLDVSKMTEEQREVFGQIIVTNLLNQTVSTDEQQKPYVSMELKQNISNGIQNILHELAYNNKNEIINDLHDIDYWGLCGKIMNKYNIDISNELQKIKTAEELCAILCEKIAIRAQQLSIQSQQSNQK